MLSKQIAQLRKNVRMSQSQLAAQLNVSPSTIGMYEQGRRVPDLPTLVSISQLFRVSLDYLVSGEESVHFPLAELHSTVHHDILAASNEQAGIVMIITDPTAIGTRLRDIRKSRKLSQAEVASAANISGRAFADIERGTTNMRVDTMLGICQALHITPDALFVAESNSATIHQQELLQKLNKYSAEDREKIYDLLSLILQLFNNNDSLSNFSLRPAQSKDC